jgi:hypothetical protein
MATAVPHQAAIEVDVQGDDIVISQADLGTIYVDVQNAERLVDAIRAAAKEWMGAQ